MASGKTRKAGKKPASRRKPRNGPAAGRKRGGKASGARRKGSGKGSGKARSEASRKGWRTRQRKAVRQNALVALAEARRMILGPNAHAADPAMFLAMRNMVKMPDPRFAMWESFAEELGFEADEALDQWFSPDVIA